MLPVLRRLKTPKLIQAEKETQSNCTWIRYKSRAPFSFCNSQRFLSEVLLHSFSLTSSTSGHVHTGRKNSLVRGLKWCTILSWVHLKSTKSCKRNGLGKKPRKQLFFFFFPSLPCSFGATRWRCYRPALRVSRCSGSVRKGKMFK